MTRGVWKGPFVHPSLLKKIDRLKGQTGRKPIKTWSRNSTVIPEFVGHSFLIHNGKTFIPITISEEMVGHKLGEFSPTRKFVAHTSADKKAAQAVVQSGAKAPSGVATPAAASPAASKPAAPAKKDNK
jgi:small subunit ribosomal protein S19